MNTRNHQLDSVAQFYLPQIAGEPNLFEIWENGGARGDSVTPSTYSEQYRVWMVDKLITELKRNHGTGMLSLGCGNAVVEAEVARKGYRVVGVDTMPEAVALAKAKGVAALCADIWSWSPDEPWPLIYMDGVLGHVYDPATGLRPCLERIRLWLAPMGGAGFATLIASNDVTWNGEPVQEAPSVPGFWWLSAEYMRDEALAAGFDVVEVERFEYERPKSGGRVRAIIGARVKTRARSALP